MKNTVLVFIVSFFVLFPGFPIFADEGLETASKKVCAEFYEKGGGGIAIARMGQTFFLKSSKIVNDRLILSGPDIELLNSFPKGTEALYISDSGIEYEGEIVRSAEGVMYLLLFDIGKLELQSVQQ